MNRKQAKELLPIIQAFAEGKTVQTIDKNGEWINCLYINFEFNSSPNSFRIKPESMYHPFANAEECWQEMQKHQPFGWVCRSGTGHYKHINSLFVNSISFQETEIAGSGNFEWSLPDLFKCYTFADGTPFGIKD